MSVNLSSVMEKESAQNKGKKKKWLYALNVTRDSSAAVKLSVNLSTVMEKEAVQNKGEKKKCRRSKCHQGQQLLNWASILYSCMVVKAAATATAEQK
jgi:hypothetical protein